MIQKQYDLGKEEKVRGKIDYDSHVNWRSVTRRSSRQVEEYEIRQAQKIGKLLGRYQVEWSPSYFTAYPLKVDPVMLADYVKHHIIGSYDVDPKLREQHDVEVKLSRGRFMSVV